MNARDLKLPEELDERLREWARFFKDRHHWERVKSLEGRFEAHSPGSWDEGWGSKDEIPPQPLAPAVELPRVLQTHQAVMELDKAGRWKVTYAYCYPHLERWQVLKFLRKYTGHRYTWNQYMDGLDIARMRVWAYLCRI